MVEISNEDYAKVKRLLGYLSANRGINLRQWEASRKAYVLLRKWTKREARKLSNKNKDE